MKTKENFSKKPCIDKSDHGTIEADELSETKIYSFVNFANETEEITIEKLMKKGYSAYEAEAYLSKLNIQRLFDNDNNGKNVDFSPDLYLPQPRIEIVKPNKIKRNINYG